MNSTRPINRCVLVGWGIALAAILGLSTGCSTVNDLFGRSNPPKSSAQTSSATTTAAIATGVGDEGVLGRLRTGDALSIRIDAGAATAVLGGAPTDATIDDRGISNCR